MKYTMLFALIVSCCFAMPAWESIGPYGAPLRHLAIAPSNEDIIYTASHYYSWTPSKIPRMYKSTDGGNSWTKTGHILVEPDTNYVYCLAVDAGNSDVVYAGSMMSVYKSTDAGATWTTDSVSNDSITDIATHPFSTSTVYAVGKIRKGVGPMNKAMAFFKSTDGGENWTADTLDTLRGRACCVVLDHSNPDILYVGGVSQTYSKVFKSTDGGSSFTDISSDLPDTSKPVMSIAVHPTDSSILYAATDYAIFRTTNAGQSWVESRACTLAYALATTPADPGVVYACVGTNFDYSQDNQILKSTDSGVSWSETDTGFHGYLTYGLAVKSTDASIAYAANSADFFKTTNGGTNWLPSNDGILFARIPCFSIAPSSPSTIYSSYDPQAVYKTTDSGNSWARLPDFGTCGNLCGIGVYNTDPDVVFCFEEGEV